MGEKEPKPVKHEAFLQGYQMISVTIFFYLANFCKTIYQQKVQIRQYMCCGIEVSWFWHT